MNVLKKLPLFLSVPFFLGVGFLLLSPIKVVEATPTINIYANGQANFLLIESPQNVTITWDSQGAASCIVNQGQWSGTSGSQIIYVSSTTVVDLYCQDGSGAVSSSDVEIGVSGVGTFDLCDPESQSANVGQPVNFTSVYLGTMSWSAPDGVPSSGTGSSFQTTFSSPGLKIVQGITGSPPKQGVDSCSVYVVETAPPTASISANPTTVPFNTNSLVSWSSTNATSCTLSNGWSATSGSNWDTGNLTSSETISVDCTGPGGSCTNCDSVTITVQPENYVVDIWLSTNPISNVAPNSITVSWGAVTGSTGPITCTASGDWSGTKSASGGSEVVTAPIGGSYSFTLYCSGGGGATGNGSDTESVFITNPQLLCSPANQTVTSGSTATLTAQGGLAPFSWAIVSGIGGSLSSSSGLSVNLTGVSGNGYLTRITDVAGQTAECWAEFGTSGQLDVTLSATLSPVSGSAPNNITLTWTITGGVATSCTAGGDWSGAKATTSGSSQVLSGVSAGTYNYSLLCSNNVPSSDSDTEQVTITATNLPPTATLSLSPNQITTSESAVIAWNIGGGNPSSCSRGSTPTVSAWNANASTSTSSQSLSGFAVGTYNFTIQCTNAYGSSVQDSIDLTVTATAQSGNPFSGSLTATGCTADYPATTCNATVTVSTTNASYTMVRKTVNGNSSTVDCVAGGVSNRTFTDTINIDESTTYTLYNASNCSFVPPTTVQANFVALWEDAGNIPSGWTCISCAGGALDNVFPRISDVYTGTGGQDTHTHTMAFGSHTSASANAGSEANGSAVPRNSHTHTFSSPIPISASNNPSYQNLVFISATSATVLPAGVILPFVTSAVPTGWETRYTSLDGYYLRASNSTTWADSPTHNHTFSGTSGGTSNGMTDGTNYLNVSNSSHTHTTSGTFSDVSNQPKYVNLIFRKSTSSSQVPIGSASLLVTATPSGLADISSTTSSYYERLVKGASTASGTGGSVTSHTHDNGSITVPSSVASSNNVSVRNSGGSVSGAAPTHTHNVTYSIGTADEASTMPRYRNVVLAQTRELDSETVTASQLGGGPRSDITTSNKDIAFIRSAQLSYDFEGNADANISETDPIVEGDDISFAVHIRNTGLGTVVGDIVVTDTLSNLLPSPDPAVPSNPDTVAGWRAAIYCGDTALTLPNYKSLFDPNQGGETTSTSCNGLYSLSSTVTYDQQGTEDVVVFTISPIGGTVLGPDEVITLVYTTKAQGATVSSSSVFRLKNKASITYEDSVDGVLFLTDQVGLETPAVLFYRSLEVPFLRE